MRPTSSKNSEPARFFETILRERRDPGLLEWSGGNLFKARVYPIGPRSEKRIKITYTQVLPMRAGTYRYQYALQSDMVQQHPLRQLEIEVRVASTLPLSAVDSPTHLTRNTFAEHSARISFSAQNYVPDQDFEAVITMDAGQRPPVTLIPHRRGDDGYFLAQIIPPDVDAARAVNEPLDLILLADTSASIDAASRRRQADVIVAILSTLGPHDTFNLGLCDVQCSWLFARPVAADAKNIEKVRQTLVARRSLGWTDLKKTIAAALDRCGPRTHVVYLGDGVATAGEHDPSMLANRILRMAAGKPGTFHAVVLGSSYENAVVQAIASVGGGSLRHVSALHGAAAVAAELLDEIGKSVVRDLKIEFPGLRTARVYPDRLPNLPPGTQQLVLGRYLPQGRDQSGQVMVTGTLAGKPVRYAADIVLKDAESGNSFVPRLWARMHLDALLEQGPSPIVKNEIIALSEEYHIITPYTSLLVLESDADRERFGVKRQFQMRDGEKFFAAGRDRANLELTQQEMRRAGNWRLNLRRDTLRQIHDLDRQLRSLPPMSGQYGESTAFGYFGGIGGMALGGMGIGGMGGGMGMGGMGMGGMGGKSEFSLNFGGSPSGNAANCAPRHQSFLLSPCVMKAPIARATRSIARRRPSQPANCRQVSPTIQRSMTTLISTNRPTRLRTKRSLSRKLQQWTLADRPRCPLDRRTPGNRRRSRRWPWPLLIPIPTAKHYTLTPHFWARSCHRSCRRQTRRRR